METNNKFRKLMLDGYTKDEIRDIAEHGCSGGVTGMTYYEETTAIYDKYKHCIWEILGDRADELGETVIAMIAQTLTAKEICNCQTFNNYCVWFAAEIVAYEYQLEDDIVIDVVSEAGEAS